MVQVSVRAEKSLRFVFTWLMSWIQSRLNLLQPIEGNDNFANPSEMKRFVWKDPCEFKMGKISTSSGIFEAFQP